MAAKMTEMKVNMAEKVAILARPEKSPGQRGEEGDGRRDGREANGADAVASDCVPPLCADEAVQAHDERVVQDEHDGGKVESPFLVPENHLTQITDITNLRVAHAELPSDEGRVENKTSNHDCEDDTRDQAENRV